MKLLFVDPENTQNTFYTYTKFLRRKGIEASLVLPTNFDIPESHFPWWHDPELIDPVCSPQWLYWQEFPELFPSIYPLKINPLKYVRQQKGLVNLAKSYDLIVCAGVAPVWIYSTGKPFVFHSFGGQLEQTIMPGFWKYYLKSFFRKTKATVLPSQQIEIAKRLGVQNLLKSLPHIIDTLLLTKYCLKSALRRAEAIVLPPQQIEIAKGLGLQNLKFLPHIIDTQLFKPMEFHQRQHERDMFRKKLVCDLILFHPPRHSWVNKKEELLIDCKGNDRLFRAFARFLRTTKTKAKLIVIEKGPDVESSRQLVRELAISDYVVWKSPMTRPELCQYYNIADMVFDQFITGIFALTALEAMTCGTATFSYVAQTPEGLFYPEMPPVVNVSTEDQLFHSLCQLAENENMREEIGRQSQEWVRRHCYWEVAIQKHIELYEQVLSTSRKN